MTAAVPAELKVHPVLNPIDMAGTLLETTNPTAYPISGISWLVVPTSLDEHSKSIVRGFICWMLDKGQMPPRAIGYAQIPIRVRTPTKKIVETYFGNCPVNNP